MAAGGGVRAGVALQVLFSQGVQGDVVVGGQGGGLAGGDGDGRAGVLAGGEGEGGARGVIHVLPVVEGEFEAGVAQEVQGVGGAAGRVGAEGFEGGEGQAAAGGQDTPAVTGQGGEQGGLADAGGAADPGDLSGWQGAQGGEFGSAADQGGGGEGGRGRGQCEAEVAGVAAQGEGQGVVGGAEDLPEVVEVCGVAGGRAGGVVGAFGVRVCGGVFGAGVVVSGEAQVGGAGFAGEGFAGVEQPFLQVGVQVGVQAVEERAGVQVQGVGGAGGAAVVAEGLGVAGDQGLDAAAVFEDSAGQGAQADEVLRQGVHGVGGVGPEQAGEAASGLRPFEAQVRQQQQGLLAAEGDALDRHSAECEKFHRTL